MERYESPFPFQDSRISSTRSAICARAAARSMSGYQELIVRGEFVTDRGGYCGRENLLFEVPASRGSANPAAAPCSSVGGDGCRR